MSSGFPIQTWSTYSIQQSYVFIDKYVEVAKALNFPAITLCDLNSLSGIPEFLQETQKQKIKSIVGCTFKVLINDNRIEFVIGIAQNKSGYFELVQILNKLKYSKHHEYYLNLDDIVNSENSNCLFVFRSIEIFNSVSLSTKYLMVELGESIPGAIDPDFVIHSDPVFYIKEEDHYYYRALLCSKFSTTFKEMESNPPSSIIDYLKYYTQNQFFLKPIPQQKSLDNILSSVESFSINSNPLIPKYTEDDPNKILHQLCRDGWQKRNLNAKLTDPKIKERYVARIKEELSVIGEFNLADYLLIVKDFIEYTRANNQSCGLRGSAVGCLIFYLLNITNIDPVWPDPTLPYLEARELSFSRFLNKGRMSKDNISLPDVDFDLPPSFRPKLVQYVKDKYGEEKIAYIITFQRLDGKGAIKETFRILESVQSPFETADMITKKMVETSKIQDILEDLREDDPNYSVIQYCVDHIPVINDFAKEYPLEFEVAKKLAQTIKSCGRHAAGIVIGDRPLGSVFPIHINPDDGEKIVAFEMQDLEWAGGVKYDFLNVAAYEKIDVINHMISNNLLEPIVSEEEFFDD